MEIGTFGTAINCIDGRVQAPVLEWMKAHCHVQYVDMITEPGLDKALSRGPRGGVESIRRKVKISIAAHRSGVVAVAGHHDCAGNPVSRQEHLEQIAQCVHVVASWGLPVRVVGLWVTDRWGIEVVSDTVGTTSNAIRPPSAFSVARELPKSVPLEFAE